MKLALVLAFCGFYVARADAPLTNDASRVVIARDGDQTVVTLSNDFDGDVSEFAMVIPVPTTISRENIATPDPAPIDHLDRYSAPRLVEYYDENPCKKEPPLRGMVIPCGAMAAAPPRLDTLEERAKARGVKIEAHYNVGEYEILILDAKESEGLALWLDEEGYRVPRGAEKILDSYLKQKMRFFVAKVDIEAHRELGQQFLRPIQVRYESSKFMLPIRLGTVNSKGPQELILYTLTRNGRVEPTNYRTARVPTGVEVPVPIKDQFPPFYEAVFKKQVEENDMATVFLEYAWNVAKCDPCPDQPPSYSELYSLGVTWGQPTFITRLHAIYDADSFPEDLIFQETHDRRNFQARYIVRHRWEGGDTCRKAKRYRKNIEAAIAEREKNLTELTHWDGYVLKFEE